MEIHTAFELKEEKEVVQFRVWLSDIERELQQGNLLEQEKLLAYLPDLINRLTKVVPAPRMGEFQLLPTPAISFPFKFGGNTKHLVNAVFLRTLSSFAITQRKPYDPAYQIVY